VENKAAQNCEALIFYSRELNPGIYTHILGYVSAGRKLLLIHSAADVYVFLCWEDNAPITVGEPLLCGTPVVNFPVGNVSAIVKRMDTIFMAELLDNQRLAQGIQWTLEASGGSDAIKLSLGC
jgi:glycosyltransferase involved in cell wall biosynthesis